MSNRKARRAAANANPSLSSAADIPLAQPVRDQPKNSKTLYQLAAEKQSELSQNGSSAPPVTGGKEPEVITTTISPDGSISHDKPLPEQSLEEEEDPIGPLGNAFIHATTFTMLYFTLSVLVHSQYRMEISWPLIFSQTATAFPILFVLTYIIRPHASTLWAQALFFAGSVVAGCYLVRVSNDDPYFAVMKRAPPLGTLWVWCVLEQRLEVALAGLAVVGGYFWWGGYSIFS